MVDPAGRPETVHATAVSIGNAGVLLRGPSGAGKSDLALRLMALTPGPLVPVQPMLVADDRVIVSRRGGVVFMSCPAPLAGLIEVRGVGIVPAPCVPEAELNLVVDLVASAGVERMPDRAEATVVCGVSIPRLALFALEAAAPLKVALAATCPAFARG